MFVAEPLNITCLLFSITEHSRSALQLDCLNLYLWTQRVVDVGVARTATVVAFIVNLYLQVQDYPGTLKFASIPVENILWR